MKKTVRNLAALFVMAVAILLSGTMTAYAYVDETEEAAAESVISEETPEKRLRLFRWQGTDSF